MDKNRAVKADLTGGMPPGHEDRGEGLPIRFHED